MIISGIVHVPTSSIKNTLVPKNYSKFTGLYKMERVDESVSFISYEASPVEAIEESGYYDDILLSERNKILWSPNIGLYHLYFIAVPQLLEMLEDSGSDFILLIHKNSMLSESESSHYQFILNWLNKNNIEWRFFDPSKTFYINNFYKVSHELISQEMIDRLSLMLNKFINNKNIKPYRKVYLSRRHIEDRSCDWIKPGLSTSSDNRLLDHDTLELFLKENGFEVIIPEQVFTNFIDQINYFNETKLLVSLSSSGISNALFMQPNTTVVEVSTTFPTAFGERDEDKMCHGMEGLQHLYHTQSFLKKQNYMSIPNHTRYSYDIMDNIKKNSILSSIFLGGANV